MSATKNRGGRPRVKPIDEARRIPMSLRVTPRIRAAILAATAVSGRSISQEIEFVLELAFGDAEEVTARIKKAQAEAQQLGRKIEQLRASL